MSPASLDPRPPDASAPAAASCPPSPPSRLAAAVAGAGGNRCGHVPGAPRFDRINLPEDANHARPVLIGQANAKLQAYYAASREGRWDPLSQGERHYRLERAIEAAGGPETDEGRTLVARLARWRQQRSERREAVTAVLMLLLAYTDIDTLNVAIPAGGGWLGLSIAWIAERTGLSASRVKRALVTLNRAGLLTSTGAGRRYDARRRRWVGAGWGPVRRLSFDLIRRIGLEVAWNGERRRRRKDRVQRARAAAPVAPPPPAGTPAERQDRVRALRQRLAPGVGGTANAPVPTAAARQAAIERTRRIAELAAAGLSPADIRQRLNEAPQPP
jgi:DNA-binding Lrp family transcriptional regulator